MAENNQASTPLQEVKDGEAVIQVLQDADLRGGVIRILENDKEVGKSVYKAFKDAEKLKDKWWLTPSIMFPPLVLALGIIANILVAKGII